MSKIIEVYSKVRNFIFSPLLKLNVPSEIVDLFILFYTVSIALIFYGDSKGKGAVIGFLSMSVKTFLYCILGLIGFLISRPDIRDATTDDTFIGWIRGLFGLLILYAIYRIIILIFWAIVIISPFFLPIIRKIPYFGKKFEDDFTIESAPMIEVFKETFPKYFKENFKEMESLSGKDFVNQYTTEFWTAKDYLSYYTPILNIFIWAIILLMFCKIVLDNI